MSDEQRRALAGTVPTTEVIRDAVTFPRDRLGEPMAIDGDRFDAWLARVQRDAGRAALDRYRATLLTASLVVGAYDAPASARIYDEATNVRKYRDRTYSEEPR